jgi:hypothetical protein
MYEAHSIQLRWKHAASHSGAAYQCVTVEATVKGPFLDAALTLYLNKIVLLTAVKTVHKLAIFYKNC